MTDHPVVEVYWRPGCIFCMMLRPRLRLAGIPLREHNIWKDERAAAFVRFVAGGNETVPTVVVGDRALVNPSVKEVVAEFEEQAPHLVPARPARRWWRRG